MKTEFETLKKFGYTIMRWPGENISTLIWSRKQIEFKLLQESEPFGIPALITTCPIFGTANNIESTVLVHLNMAHQISY